MHALWGGSWFVGVVVAVRGQQVRVHYEGWSDHFDEVVMIDRLRLRNAQPKPAAAANSSEAADNGLRNWSDTTGKFKIAATFVKVENGKVTLKQADGTTLSILLNRLSAADQEFVKEHAAK